jgi:hypothetical protein
VAAWGRAEASATARVQAGKRSKWERRKGANHFTLSPCYAWRIPQRCATDMLCVADHIGVCHACLPIVQNKPKCLIDNNLDIA